MKTRFVVLNKLWKKNFGRYKIMKLYQRATGYLCVVVAAVCWVMTLRKVSKIQGVSVQWVGYMFASCGLIFILLADLLDPDP